MTLQSTGALPLDPSKLPQDYPRKFVPRDFMFNWENLEKLFDLLQVREVNSTEDLKAWLDDESELNSKIFEEKYTRLVRTTLQTDNKEFEKENLDFIQNLEPMIKRRSFDLDKKYASLKSRKELLSSDSYYFVLDRKKDNNVFLYRQENIELEAKDQELAQEYRKVVGGMMVSYKGEEKTIYQMAKLLEEPERALRNEGWVLTQSRMRKDSNALDNLYDNLVAIRHKIARNAGFDNFRDYSFRKRERFDYTVEDNLRFHEAVEMNFVPVARKLDKERREDLGVDILRPWDLQVDPKGRDPLRPFNEISQALSASKKIFQQIDSKLVTYFSRMVDLSLLDLESRKGKATGGYMIEFTEKRLPFIFMNAVGKDSDVRVLLHECGHSFQSFLTRDRNLNFLYRGENLPPEFAEVASTTMELIGGEHMDGTFYDKEGEARSNRAELEQMIKLFTWVATIDSFQHWVYVHPDHTREERAKEWTRIFQKFQGLENWEGFEENIQNRWHMQLHLYESPFYYLEYGIATLGALGLWVRYRNDRKDAVSLYESALSLGGSKPLPELFGAAGLPWDFGAGIVEKYAHELEKALRETT